MLLSRRSVVAAVLGSEGGGHGPAQNPNDLIEPRDAKRRWFPGLASQHQLRGCCYYCCIALHCRRLCVLLPSHSHVPLHPKESTTVRRVKSTPPTRHESHPVRPRQCSVRMGVLPRPRIRLTAQLLRRLWPTGCEDYEPHNTSFAAAVVLPPAAVRRVAKAERRPECR